MLLQYLVMLGSPDILILLMSEVSTSLQTRGESNNVDRHHATDQEVEKSWFRKLY